MATTYRIRFNNAEEQLVECTLTDETGELDIIDIEGAEDAVTIVSQDNDENKFSPIKAKKCVIKFLNSQSVNLRTFATGEDNKWLVTVKINSLTVFIGHLEQGDIEEPFQYEENQIVVLTATDGLGALKTHRLEDVFNIWTPDRLTENRIIDYVASCLGATGLELTINVINNLREIDNPATDLTTFGNIYAALYLNIKTFEDGQPEFYLNCYEILERILGHDCYLTQAKGQWWIVRVTELRQDLNMGKTIFDFDGTVLSFDTLNYDKGLGLKDVAGTPFAATPDATAYFSQDKTIISLQRPVKSVRLTYKYENPLEILCNQFFKRATFIADLPDETDADGNTRTAQSFDPECWTYNKGVPVTTNDSDGYLKITYRDGAEIERYLHAEPTASDTFYYWSNAGHIDVGLNDKLTINMSVKYGDDVAGTGLFLKTQAQLRLIADDGTFWTCHVSFPGVLAPEPGKFWLQAPDGTWTTDQEFLIWEDDADSVDFSQWNTLTFECPPVPRSGKIEFILVNADAATARTKDFNSIQIDYIPYINGYNVFASQSDISTRDGSYFSSIEDDVYISNSPRPIFKGALLKKDGDNFPVVGLFYEGQQFDETTGLDHLASYGELRVRAYHNQFRNGDEIYKATCQGLGEGIVDFNGLDDHQDLIHRYYNRDMELTNIKMFQLVNQEVDLRNCEWTGTLIKNFDTEIGFVTDTYTFQLGLGSVGGGGSGGIGGGGVAAGSFPTLQQVFDTEPGGSILTRDDTIDLNGFDLMLDNLPPADKENVVYYDTTTKAISYGRIPLTFTFSFQQITPGTDPIIAGNAGLNLIGANVSAFNFISTGVYDLVFAANVLLDGRTVAFGSNGSGLPGVMAFDFIYGSDSDTLRIYTYDITGTLVDSGAVYGVQIVIT